MGILGIVVGVLPFVGSIVQGIESLFGHGDGATKKAAALATIQAALGAYSAAVPSAPATATLQADLGVLVDAVVAVYNDLGIFTHAAKPAAPGKG